jgi:hypothetical protein
MTIEVRSVFRGQFVSLVLWNIGQHAFYNYSTLRPVSASKNRIGQTVLDYREMNKSPNGENHDLR